MAKKKSSKSKKKKVKADVFWGEIKALDLADLPTRIPVAGQYSSTTAGCPTTCTGGHDTSPTNGSLWYACCF